MAKLAAAVGRSTEAVRLLAAGEALRERLGVPIQPTDRDERDRSLGAARDAVGEAAFRAGWAEGQSLSLEDAIGEAQRIVSELRDRAQPVASGPSRSARPGAGEVAPGG